MPKSVAQAAVGTPVDIALGVANNVGVTPDELIAHFGGVSATARALGVKDPSVSEWKTSGVVPELRQYQAEIATGGKLKADAPALRQPPRQQAVA